MSENLKDILSNLNPETDQELLLQYLQGSLSAAQQHGIEEGSLQDDFDADALEGLSQVKDKKSLQAVIDNLNNDLKQRTEKKKKRRQKLHLKLEPWLLISIVVVILIIIISFLIIHRKAHGTP